MPFVSINLLLKFYDGLELLFAIPGVARVSERFGRLGAHTQGQTKQYCKHS